MIKWVRYHFLHLNEKRWYWAIFWLVIVVVLLFFYFGGFLEAPLERLFFEKEYLFEYQVETFTLLNLLAIIWVLMGTKEIYLLDEPHIFIINKRKYIISKAIAYLIFYQLIFLLFYSLYQLVLVALFGFMNFDYSYLWHLLLNVFFLHGFVIFISGKTSSVIKMILLIVLLFSLDKLKGIDFRGVNLLSCFYPTLSLTKPKKGYLEIVLTGLFYYFSGFFKHENN